MSDGKVVKVVLQLENGEYVARLQASGREHEAFSAKVTGAASTASQAVGSVGESLQAVGAASQAVAPANAVLAQTATQAVNTRAALNAATPSAQALGAAVGNAGQLAAAGLSQADKQAQNLGMSTRAYSAALRGVPAQVTDIVVGLQGGQAPMTVLLQQGGQLRDVFGGAVPAVRALATTVAGMVSPLTLVLGAAGVLAMAYKQGSAEADAFRYSVVMSGNAAGTSVGQLTDMARAIAQVTGTQGAASAALAEMAGSGAVARDNLQQFAQTAMDLDRHVGVPVQAVVGNLESLANAPLQASIKLNQQYHYLTAAVYDHIKALDEQGRKDEAGAVAQRAYMSAMEARKNEIVANLGSIERGWNAVTSAAKRGWDAILNVGREETAQQKLDAISTRIAQLRSTQESGGFSNTEGGAATGRGGAGAQARERELQALLATQAALQENVRLERRSAEAQAEGARQVEVRAAWDKVVAENLSKQAREELEIKNIREKGKAAGKDAAEIDKQIAAYRERTADKSAAGTRELERQKSLLAELAGLSSTFYRDWENLNKQFKDSKLTAAQLAQEQEKLLAKQPAIKAAREAELKVMLSQLAVQQQIAEEIAQAEVARTQAVYTGRQAVLDYSRGVSEATQLLEVERQTVTGTASQRALAVEMLRIELELERQLDAIRKNQGFDQADRDEQEARARAAAAQARANATSRAELDHVRELRNELQRTTEQYEQGLTNAAMQGGKSLKEYVVGMLRTTAFRIALQPVIGGSAQLLASVTGTAGSGATGGMDGISGLVNAGGAIYNALATGVSNSIASAFGKFATSAVGQSLGLSTAATVGNNASAYVAPQLTGVGSAIGTGLGMLGNGFAGYGLSKAISGGYTTGGNTVNALAGVASAFFGPLAGIVGGLINRAFGRKLADMGVEGTLGGAGGFEGSAYQFYKGGWLRSDKTKYQDLDPATARTLSESFKAIQAQVGSFATALGLQTDKIASFTTALKVSTQGLDEAGIQAVFQEALAKGSNELAEQVLGSWTQVTEQVTETIQRSGATDAADAVFEQVERTITRSTYTASEYAKAGEQAIDTLARLANSFTTVNTLSDAMGYGFHQASLAGADAASRIADAFGGLEAFARSMGSYIENYYTGEEQRAATARQAARALSDAGLDVSAERLLTATRAQIRTFVEGVLAEFGAESTQYVTAVTQANALAAITEPLQSATQAVAVATTAATDAMREYEARMKAIADERKSLQDQIDQLTLSRAELIAKERAAIDESNRALFDRLTALQEEARIADERAAIEQNWLNAIGATATLRQQELGTIDPANQALQQLVYRLQDLQTAATKATASTDSSMGVLARSVDAEKKALADRLVTEKEAIAAQQDAVRASVSGIKAVFDAVQSALKATKVESDELDRARRAAALATVQGAALMARAGASVDKLPGLQDALATLSKPSDKLYGRFEDYARAQDEAADAMRQLGDQAGGQLSTAEKALKANEDAAKLLDKQYQQDIAALDQTLATWREQIDAVRGVDISVLKVEDAVSRLAAALLAERTAVGAVSATGSLAQYSPAQVVGGVDYLRDAAARGDLMAIYEGAAGAGLNVDQLTAAANLAGYTVGADDIRNWVAAQGLASLPESRKFATGAAFLGGGVVQRPTHFDIGQMGEAGKEAIVPLANLNGKLGVGFGGLDFSPIVDALERLNERLQVIENNTEAGAVHAFNGVKATQELLDRGVTVRTSKGEPLEVAA